MTPQGIRSSVHGRIRSRGSSSNMALRGYLRWGTGASISPRTASPRRPGNNTAGQGCTAGTAKASSRTGGSLIRLHHAHIHGSRHSFDDSPVSELPPYPFLMAWPRLAIVGYPDRVVAVDLLGEVVLDEG